MIDIGIASALFLLIFWHCLADYPLQGDFIAAAKNKNTDLGKTYWKVVLPAHAMIHAGGVFIITQSLVCAIVELVSHTITDYLKCEDKITFNQDQAIHVAFKVIIAALFYMGL